MGRPKIKVIDDSVQEEVKEKKPSKKMAKRGEAIEASADQSLSEPGDDGQNAQALTSVTPSEPVTEGQASLTGEQADSEPIKESRTQKPGKALRLLQLRSVQVRSGQAKPRSKKYQEASKNLDKTQSYSVTEAVELAKKLSYSKFTGTLEAHINTRVSNLRGLVTLPYASGKKLTILAFGPSTTLRTIDDIIPGDDNTIEEIIKGKVNFDLVVTTPEWMPKLAKIARILGPRGLMPNPKNGTITTDLKKAVEGFQAGKTEYEQGSKILYRTEAKAQVIHLGLGKLDQPTEELAANVTTLLQTLGKSRVKKVSISPTIGPSVKLDLSHPEYPG